MLTIVKLEVDGYICTIQNTPFSTRNSRRTFDGQKIKHPYDLSGGKPNMYTNDITPEMESILSECEHFEIKSDGSCGALLWTGTELIPYARFDIKEQTGKKIIDGDPYKTTYNTQNWIQCEDKPCIEHGIKKHWPHFRPISEDLKQYKWYMVAFNHCKKDLMDNVVPFMERNELITIEYMGPHFNNPSYDSSLHDTILIHGTLIITIPKELRTFNGFQKIFQTFPIEGVVLYPNNHPPMKIRANLMGCDPNEADIDGIIVKYGLGKQLVAHAQY
jgi:hypothetical protein